jgi:hypothetical protein
MVYNTQNYWVSGLCLLSRILNARKQHSGNWICCHPQVSRHLLPHPRTDQFLKRVFYLVFRILDDGRSPDTK